MKLAVRSLPLFAILLTSLLGFAADKKNPLPGRVVDAGTFGIFVKGQRVASEKFEIAQQGDGNITRAELKLDGSDKAVQKTELQLSGSGELRHYSWNELSPGKAQTTVDPDQQFLMERIIPSPQEKAIDQAYILPASTAILDDYFFSHRELLTWRYLGSNCSQTITGQTECKLSKAQFGVLIPRQRASVLVTVEFIGKEKVMIRGQEFQLNRFNLLGEGMEWALWFDDAHKLQRVVIASDYTEVVRD